MDLVAAVKEEEGRKVDLIAELHCHCQKRGLLKSRVGIAWSNQIQPSPNIERRYGIWKKDRVETDETSMPIRAIAREI